MMMVSGFLELDVELSMGGSDRLGGNGEDVWRCGD